MKTKQEWKDYIHNLVVNNRSDEIILIIENALSKIEQIDEILRDIEDVSHGEYGDKITEARKILR